MSDEAIRKSSADVLILSLLEERDRHGYEIAKLIDQRSGGAFTYHVASLYPMLYRLERRGLILGRWVEAAGERRRRFYRLTPEGRTVLNAQRRSWRNFIAALNRVARIGHA
jgi:transcriptional regulator